MPPWRCRLHLRRGRILFQVEITEKGEIVSVGERRIYSASELGFGLASIERITLDRG